MSNVTAKNVHWFCCEYDWFEVTVFVVEPSLMLKRAIPTSALLILPRTGHTLNLEEPELFNATVERFMAAVENGEWGTRDPRATAGSITGVRTS